MSGLTERLWQDLLDKDDRTSPAEYPDHALITFDEFQSAIAEAVANERERIAQALEGEADLLPCEEDANVTRSNANLVRANFSYEEAERLEEVVPRGPREAKPG